MSPISRDDYHIAVICALPRELTALMAVLDGEYDFHFGQDAEDHNTYVLGRVAKQNVVMACCPVGETGTNAAAKVASDLQRTFRHIHSSLMVGIGGGIPSSEIDQDIRLGDVVVSQPGGTFGGVVQYDHGKNLADGNFLRKGSLNAPSHALRSALSVLKSQSDVNGSQLPSILAEIEKKHPRLKAKGFCFPGREHDRLFCARCSSSKRWWRPVWRCHECENGEVLRQPRESTDPVVYTGLSLQVTKWSRTPHFETRLDGNMARWLLRWKPPV